MEFSQLEIVGHIGDTALSIDQLTHLFQHASHEKIGQGESFEGRPNTKLYITDHYVIKLRQELTFSARDARRWVGQRLTEEKLWQVHHPSKTWFLIFPSADSKPIIASITQRLTPLNQICRVNHPPERWHDLFEQMITLYLCTVAQHQRVLDDGLSNFGVDNQHRLYYLDDETYASNQLLSLAHGVAVWIRQLTWLTSDDGTWLGQILQHGIRQNFDDPHWLFVLCDQLKEIFWTGERQEAVSNALIKGLFDKKAAVKTHRTIQLNLEQPLAILADIHANLPALEVVLDWLKQQGIQQGIILGDLVGYGPYPVECVQRVRQLGWPVIKGNHDHGLAIPSARSLFSKQALSVIEWSAEQMPEDDKQWLLSLPPYLELDHWLALHGSPADKQYMYGYVYAMTYTENLDALQERGKKICFHGHSHLQGVYYRRKKIDDHSKADKFDLAPVDHALVCPGSVGQPRGGHAGAEFAIFHPKQQKIQFIHLDYAIDRICQRMTELDFPATLIRRLNNGT